VTFFGDVITIRYVVRIRHGEGLMWGVRDGETSRRRPKGYGGGSPSSARRFLLLFNKNNTF